MYESNRRSVGVQRVNDADFVQNYDNDEEIADIFPALKKYKAEHNAVNLKKLCVEISDFCRSVYASTQSDEERQIYKAMISKLMKPS